ncbi:ATP-binding protein [Pseudomonas sp. LRF_L74]|uniref:ATP-binding protein n=1 Tax=Pseudomonas sp. LRF_L74 TaxID=3369422 RepID=UPI003F640C2D
MDISLTNRLSFKQASITVLVAFILGTLLSLVQVGLDYASEDAAIDREIRSLLEISHNPAARIAYNIDAELAQELVVGLLRSPAVIRAEIIDSSGLTLASVQRPASRSGYRVLSDMLFGDSRQFVDQLFVSHEPDESLGVLRLQVDTYAFGNHFLERSLLTLLTGFARSLLLALILLVLFYFMLTKPLISTIRSLTERDPKKDFEPIPCPRNHELDEIGTLVAVINQQLSSIHDVIDLRREAEDRLTQYLGELEHIVSARTAELKATNARLTLSNNDLEAARRTALEMAQARASLLASMSHEIRTPLNGLLGMLSLTLDGKLTDEQRQQLAIAHNSGKILVELLNDILDLSKHEAGQLELERIPFDLGTLAEDTASLLSQNASPMVELTCLVDPRLPALILGDPTRVRQIVSNLLSNALKFTRTGRVDLRVSPTASGVRVEVRDTGIGIAAEAQARIFQPYTQAGAGITRQYGGTGLGLALTRRLCEAMDGKLVVESVEGDGSRFVADLPLPSHQPAQQWTFLKGQATTLCHPGSGLEELLAGWLPHWGLAFRQRTQEELGNQVECDLLICDDSSQLPGLRRATQAPILLVTSYGGLLGTEGSEPLAPFSQLARPLSRAALYKALQQLLSPGQTDQPPGTTDVPASLHKARVLLVEDNAVNQMVARGMLVKLGCEVGIAANGVEAIEYLQENPADLVLMDCNMPVMDGYEATRRIRQMANWPELPIIALTANALPEERERCQAAGMDDYMAKPFRREDLVALLEAWLPIAP